MLNEEIRKQVLEETRNNLGTDDYLLDKPYIERAVIKAIDLTIALMKSEQDKIDFNVVHMSGCNRKKEYCFCDLEIAKHKADTPSEKLLKILWDSGISIPEAVQTKEELIAWLLDRITDKDKEIALMKSSQDEIIKGYKIQLKTAWEQIDILKAEQEKNYISIEEHNKVIDKTKDCIRAEHEKELEELGNKIAFLIEQKDTLSEKIDKVVDEWNECPINKGGTLDELKQNLKEAVGK